MKRLRTTTSVFYMLLTTCTFGKVAIWPTDTVKIYKNKTLISYSIYKQVWFPRNGGFSITKMNKQDSIVLVDTAGYYFKVYNQHNKILFEGQKRSGGTGEAFAGLIGDIKFYRKNGTIKKVEEWEPYGTKDTSTRYIMENNLRIVGAKYFRQDGSIKKSFEYIINIKSKTPLSYCYVKQTIFYKKNGQKKSIKQKTDRCYVNN